MLSPLRGALLAICAVTLFASGYSRLWVHNVWFPWLIFIALQIPATFVWSLAYNSVRLHVEKRILHDSLAMHLSPARVAQLLARPELLKPGAEKQGNHNHVHGHCEFFEAEFTYGGG